MADKRISDLNALTVTASDDTALVSDTSASETKKISLVNFFKTPQALSGAGAANLTTSITNCTSTGAAQVVTLADGVQGQVKIVSHIVDGGSVRVTPTNLDGGTYVTLDAVGDTVVFLFNDSAWQIIGGYGHAVT